MKRDILLRRLTLLIALWLTSESGGVIAQTMASARQQTMAGQTGKSAALTRMNLRQLLTQLETTYQVHFNYKATLVKDVTVLAPPVTDFNGRIASQLNTLLSTSLLQCRTIDARTFVIRAQAGTDQSGLDKVGLSPMAPAMSGAEPAGTAAPQDRVLTGRVTSEAGEELPGVNVVVKGTSRGTTTDASGNYQLSVTDADARGTLTLAYSYIGYVTQEVAVGNRNVVNVKLVADNKTLNEVVVVGYGTQSRKNLTSAISTIKPEELNRGAIADVGQLLQGKVPGLNISTNGDPNQTAAVVLRGASTINSSQGPFYVIDGVPGADISIIAPDDIAQYRRAERCRGYRYLRKPGRQRRDHGNDQTG